MQMFWMSTDLILTLWTGEILYRKFGDKKIFFYHRLKIFLQIQKK